MQSANEQSPLLRLPAELRNAIYEYVLCNKFITVKGISPPPSMLGLPRTCRQIYQETELLSYSGNTFQVAKERVLTLWLRKRTARQLAVISSLLFTYEMYLRWSVREQEWYTLSCSTVFPGWPKTLDWRRLTALRRVGVYAAVHVAGFPDLSGPLEDSDILERMQRFIVPEIQAILPAFEITVAFELIAREYESKPLKRYLRKHTGLFVRL